MCVCRMCVCMCVCVCVCVLRKSEASFLGIQCKSPTLSIAPQRAFEFSSLKIVLHSYMLCLSGRQRVDTWGTVANDEY